MVNSFAGFWLVTNYSCNNRCWWCYAQTMKFKPTEMSLPYATDVINLMSQFEVSKGILIGGEPTIHAHFKEILREFSSRNMGAAIVSNGRRYSDKEFVEELKSIVQFGTTVSMQSNREDVHDAITRRKGSFRETLEGLRNCVDLKVPVSVQVTVTPDNKADILEFIRMVEAVGVTEFVVGFGLPPFEDDPSMNGLIHVEEVPDIIRDIYRATKDWDIHVVFNQFIPLCMYGDDLEEMLEKKSIRAGCHVNLGNMVVWEPDGGISPCAHFSGKLILDGLMNERGGLIPNTPEKFLTLWNSDVLVSFRKDRYSYISPHCNECEYWGLCTGGCPINWFYYNPTSLVGRAHEGR